MWTCTCVHMRACVCRDRNSEVKKQGARWKKESERRENLRWGDREKEEDAWVLKNIYLAVPDLSCGTWDLSCGM